MIKIIHITPHLGGGVGNIISNLILADDINEHKVISLEKPIIFQYVEKLRHAFVDIIIDPSLLLIEREIKWSDITIIHWWHHPKTSKLLYYLPEIPSRVVIWTHISSLTVPALNPGFLLKATRVFFTTESSYESECFKEIDEVLLRKKAGVVPGTIGFDNYEKRENIPHEGFNIGYLGLVDFSKLHRNFIDFCAQVKIPNARFIMAGDNPAKDMLIDEAKAIGLDDCFVFLGHVEDVPGVLAQFDVLGYPLMPTHTCTTENAVLEAMASEVPPVLLDQLVEKHIVKNGETGMLVSNPKEYGIAMRYLFDNPNNRIKMGKKARQYVLNKYRNNDLLRNFYDNCEKVMRQPRDIISFKEILGETPSDWFISGIGKDSILFKNIDKQENSILKCSEILKGNNKSSVMQYAREFPDDKRLMEWMEILNKTSRRKDDREKFS